MLQAHYVAEILQRVKADVLLVSGFDHDLASGAGASSMANALACASASAQRFQDSFPSVSHGRGATGRGATEAISYACRYTPNANTGLPSGFDLNNSAVVAGGDDAYGFGNCPAQFGLTIYSKYEIVGVRTFQTFLWKDMPGNLLMNDPTSNPLSGAGGFLGATEVGLLRLPSKNHVDVTLLVAGHEVHFLATHPTPPTLDGAEDRNGKRNHDAIRFWADYVAGAAKFVIAGDYNADPLDGDSFEAFVGGAQYNAIGQLLDDPPIADPRPSSVGGEAAATAPANESHPADPRMDTTDVDYAAPGTLRVDYVLPSATLEVTDAGVN